MKIAIVCYPTFGGSGVVATELGLELARRGHEIHFITYSQPVRLALLNANVHYHEVNVPEYFNIPVVSTISLTVSVDANESLSFLHD